MKHKQFRKYTKQFRKLTNNYRQTSLQLTQKSNYIIQVTHIKYTIQTSPLSPQYAINAKCSRVNA